MAERRASLATVSATTEVIDQLIADLNRVRARTPRVTTRPFVTLAYAQSVDGSIALEAGRPYPLSGPEAMRMTHALRAAHDGILIGIGTLLSDDPRLTVRLVSGRSPQPVVVDSRLRTPPEAKLSNGGSRGAWIATTPGADEGRRAGLEARGARVLDIPAWANGWVDLPALMERLAGQGIAHLMVEGGARIITSFLRARLVDYAVVTVTPRFLGGMPALSAGEREGLPRLQTWASHRVGDDLVLSGELRWAPVARGGAEGEGAANS